ncbi:MAG: hypothetical protein LBR84_06920 [Tannerella sp.]|jgi:hypothetical protein|nr:hypothetical protein [Tannerella sp.]
MRTIDLRKVLVLAASVIMLLSCDELFNSAEKGRQASAEACNCIKSKSVSECEDELNKKYGYYDNDDDFISAFNSANTCNITIYKKK